MKEFLRPGRYIDSAHPVIVRFASENAPGSTERERAVSLYYAVRDKVRYNPFLDFSNDRTAGTRRVDTRALPSVRS